MKLVRTSFRRARRESNSPLSLCLATLVLAVMLCPIVMIAVMSFSAANNLQFPPPGFSLHWYGRALELAVGWNAEDSVERLSGALGTSLLIAVLTTLAVVAAGVPAAYALQRLEFPGKAIIEQMINLPVVFPMVVLGVALLIVFNVLGLEAGVGRLVLAHSLITLPFMVRNCTAALAAVGREVEWAAYTLGANRLRTLLLVVVPLMKPGIIAGMLLAFVISINEFTVTYFLYSVDAFPLSIWMFSRTASSLDPTVFALGTITILFDFAAVWVIERLVGDRGLAV